MPISQTLALVVEDALLPKWMSHDAPLAKVLQKVCQKKSPVAGSFALWFFLCALYRKVPAWIPSDVDVWCSDANREYYKSVIEAVNAIGKVSLSPRKNVMHVESDELPFPIQFVTHREITLNPFTFLRGFDLSVCQVALVSLKRSGGHWEGVFVFYDKQVLPDIVTGVSRYFSPWERRLESKRVLKYFERGFGVREGPLRTPMAAFREYGRTAPAPR